VATICPGRKRGKMCRTGVCDGMVVSGREQEQAGME